MFISTFKSIVDRYNTPFQNERCPNGCLVKQTNKKIVNEIIMILENKSRICISRECTFVSYACRSNYKWSLIL